MPKNRRIRRAYRQNELRRICTLPERKFGRVFGMQTVDTGQKWAGEDYYHFRDNGSNVLAVAHLDTVVSPERRTPQFSTTKSGPLVVSGALDDRLGAYVILKLLPRLGVTCDWLLTVGEESGQSTAEYFKPEKDYDWVIEFDRAGTDVVMYQYEDRASQRAVEASGATVGNGSFSDIAYLEHLGVKAFNWGVGYDGNYHSVNGYAYLGNTFAMVAKYLRFHAQNAGTTMPHTPSRWNDGSTSSARYTERDYDYDCPFCQGKTCVDECTLICRSCAKCLDCGEDEFFCQCFIPASPADRDLAPARESEPDSDDELEDRITSATSMFNRQPEPAKTGLLALPPWQANRNGEPWRAEHLPAIGDADAAVRAEAEMERAEQDAR